MGALTQQQLTTRRALVTRYNAIDTAIGNLISGSVASFSISTGTGSKSYTKIQIPELRREMTIIAYQIQAIDNSGRPKIIRTFFRSH